MIAAVLIALLALAVVGAIAWPVVTGRAAGEDALVDPDRVELEAQIAASLSAIREIDFDHRAGNLSDEDFAELDRAERANAARLIRRRDANSKSS